MDGQLGFLNDYDDEIGNIEYSCDLSKFPSSTDISEYGEVLKVYENGLLIRSGSEKAKEEYGDVVFLVCDDAWAYGVGQVVTYVFRDIEPPAQEGYPLNKIALIVYME